MNIKYNYLGDKSNLSQEVNIIILQDRKLKFTCGIP